MTNLQHIEQTVNSPKNFYFFFGVVFAAAGAGVAAGAGAGAFTSAAGAGAASVFFSSVDEQAVKAIAATKKAIAVIFFILPQVAVYTAFPHPCCIHQRRVKFLSRKSWKIFVDEMAGRHDMFSTSMWWSVSTKKCEYIVIFLCREKVKLFEPI